MQLKEKCVFSQGIALTDEQIRMLERCIPKFRAADPNGREKLIKGAADHVESVWTGDIEFNRDTVISVCELSVKLNCSHIFLAYSPISVRQS
jgi:hypothetical protein